MIEVTLNVNIKVENIEEAKIMAHDLHDLLNSSGITNSIEIDKYSILEQMK